MGYNEGGLGKNGHGIVVPITPKMKSLRIGLGYGVVVSSLPTPRLAAPREVLFVAGGVHNLFPKEQPTAEQIDELVVSIMP
jgi:hypothetical protein